MKISLAEKILPSYYEPWYEYDNPKYLNIYEKGGRGSSKSTTIACKIVINRMERESHALCVRKHANTLRHSVRNQIIWAINHLEVSKFWFWSNANSGDMTLTYIPKGTKIFFEGADGERIKGWKTPDKPTTDIFFEEIQQYKTDEELSSIKLSILREKLKPGLKYTFFHAYNPPKRKQSWVNKLCESQFRPDNMYVHHSDYLSNPFLPQEFVDEANNKKEKNPHRYNWEYLGHAIGGGVVPFDNLTFRTITKEERDSFDNIRQGLDWGYSVDPLACVRMHLDTKKRKLYIFDEIYGIKIKNPTLAKMVIAKGFNDTLITCDVDPLNRDEAKESGISRIIQAKKGPGSVEFGEEWLDGLDEIVIDPKTAPNTAREFEGADYQVDKDGNLIAKLIDADNHTIDATRYGCERDMLNKKLKAVLSI